MENINLREITESECDALLNTYSQFDQKAKEFIKNHYGENFYSTFMMYNPDLVIETYQQTQHILGLDMIDVQERYFALFETIKEIKS